MFITQVVAFCHQDYPDVPEWIKLYAGGKFVLLKDGALLVGNLDRHSLLVILQIKGALPDGDIEERAYAAASHYRKQVVSAGQFYARGEVSWGSSGFGISRRKPLSEPGLEEEITTAIRAAIQDEPRLVAPRPPGPKGPPPPSITRKVDLGEDE